MVRTLSSRNGRAIQRNPRASSKCKICNVPNNPEASLENRAMLAFSSLSFFCSCNNRLYSLGMIAFKSLPFAGLHGPPRSGFSKGTDSASICIGAREIFHGAPIETERETPAGSNLSWES